MVMSVRLDHRIVSVTCNFRLYCEVRDTSSTAGLKYTVYFKTDYTYDLKHMYYLCDVLQVWQNTW